MCEILRIDHKMSQTVYSPGPDGFPDGSRMNPTSKEATGPPVGGPPNGPNLNNSLGKIFLHF